MNPKVVMVPWSFLLVTAILASNGCDNRLRVAPARDEVCGTWMIDWDRTSWREARELAENGTIDRESGHLEIRDDGTFSIDSLPDFSMFRPSPMEAKYSDTGTWTFKSYGQKPVYISLTYETGKNVVSDRKGQFIYILQEGDEYVLHVTIGDPDSNNILILRRCSDPPPSKTAD
jgi:hypothetical protein